MNQRVGVFGSNGYLGSETISLCRANNIRSVALGRKIEDLDSSILDGLVAIIDCGFPRDYYRVKSSHDYLKQIKKRARFCNERGIKYVYLTTFTSIISDNSKYARLKNSAETSVELLGGELLRLGLVVDLSNPGGRFLELNSIIRRLPIVLIPSSNWFPVFTCTLSEYLAEIKTFLQNGSLSIHQIGKIQPLSELIEEVSKDKKVLKLSNFITFILAQIIPFIAFGKMEGIKGIAFKNVGFDDGNQN
jgi:hypothetical protein